MMVEKRYLYNVRGQDCSQFKSKEIYSYLKDLTMEMMKLKGYKPETTSLLQEMDDEEKESDLVQHSVKLAVAYALIIVPEGKPIWNNQEPRDHVKRW